MIPISVGICAYEEEKNIGNLLNFLHKVKLKKFKIVEIIIVASGCKDRTVDIVKKFMKIDKRIKLIIQKERKGKPSALNLIIKNYKTNFLTIVDADRKINKNSLQSLLNRIDCKTGVVTGCPVPIGNKTIAEKITQIFLDIYNFSQKYFTLNRKFCHVSGELFVMRRDICDYIPLDIVNDDAYIAIQCKLKKYDVVMEEKAKAYLKAPTTISDLINQRRRFLYGHFKVKKETGFSPPVLEMSPLKDQLKIIFKFLKNRWYKAPYFFIACLLELYIHILAKIDMCKKENPHVKWKIAKTTKKIKW